MTTLFAEMNDALNDAVVSLLADTEADFGDGGLIPGLFRRTPAEAFGMVSGNRPVFEAKAAAIGWAAYGDTVSINGQAYAIAEIQDDGNGMIALVLEEE